MVSSEQEPPARCSLATGRSRLPDGGSQSAEDGVVGARNMILLSVEGLNQAGYRVIHNEDEEESGAFAAINKKIDKAKSFPFMSEHSNLFSLKLEQMIAT